MGAIRNSRHRARASGRSVHSQLILDVALSLPFTARIINSIEAHRSYSQFGEDCVIRSLLPERFGSYLDLGAGHPTRNSNTYLLYRRGWRGTLVEPIAELANSCRTTRRRDTVLNCLVSTNVEDDSTADFWEFHPSELSTTVEGRAHELVQNGEKLVRQYRCVVRDINSLLSTVQPDAPFLFTIDLEGRDWEIFRCIDWSIFRPRVICVEDPSRLSCETELSLFMKDLDYQLISQHTVSSIYLHSSYVR